MSNKNHYRQTETKLSNHKQFKKELKPPLLQINMCAMLLLVDTNIVI